jgi:hypothetical protein
VCSAVYKQLTGDEKDRQFLARYADMANSLPSSQGGMWLLLRRLEAKLSNDVLANLWQDGVIYGLIGGTEAARACAPGQLLLRFSLTEFCLCCKYFSLFASYATLQKSFFLFQI